jgi:2-methylcitrate dehydratase PrpD
VTTTATPPPEDLVHHFARFAAAVRFDQLPVEAAETAKKSITDTLGVILAASGLEPAVCPVVDLVLESGGTPEATVLAFGGRVPADQAAFANGALAHCLDFDDQTPWGQHSGSSVVPAVLAVAERRGGVAGGDLVAAVAAGQDIFARLRRHVAWRKDWNLSTVMGVFAATAAAGRVLDLTPTELANALGIASMQCSGLMEVVAGPGSDLRGLYAGFSARGAVVATLLAAKGLSGVPHLFEGQYGFFATYFPDGYDREAMLAGLGSEFTGAGTLYKPWPSVGTSHSHIHATLQLVAEHQLAAADIAEIRCSVGDYHALMCTPLDERRSPTTLADARFSLPFLVALAAAKGRVGLADFSPAGLIDPQVLTTARKVVPVPDASLNWTLELPPGRVELVTTGGRAYSRTGTGVPGTAQAPLTWDNLLSKFGDCVAVSVNPLPAHQVTALGRRLRCLEEAADATESVQVLGTRAAPPPPLPVPGEPGHGAPGRRSPTTTTHSTARAAPRSSNPPTP